MKRLDPRTRRIAAMLAIAAALLLGALAWWQMAPRNGGGAAARPDLDDARRIASGRHVYQQHCAACHGADLEGQADWKSRRPDGTLPAPPHDDSGHTWHHPFEVLFGLTKHGLVPPYGPANYRSAMPAFGERLSDEEIWNVLAFIRSRWSDTVRAKHAELDRRYHTRRR